jgi:nitroreductase
MSESQAQVAPSPPHSIAPPVRSWIATLRPVEADVHPMFVERWSPRAFTAAPVPPEDLRALFEAARWAPSAANEQPWRFVYASTPEERATVLPTLLPMNRAWAEHAPVLALLFARKHFAQDGPFHGAPNSSAQFDAGAAWMSLALQAHLLGLSTHAMGGIDRAEAHRRLGVSSEEYDAVVAIAIGYRAAPSSLAEPLASREVPSPRRPQSEFAIRAPSAPVSSDGP